MTYADDVATLREWMGGEGELRTPEEIEAMWREFSTAFGAHWLTIDDGLRGNFCAYLIGQVLTLREVVRPLTDSPDHD